jgi:hypothetical protein
MSESTSVTKVDKSSAIKSTEKELERASQTGFFNISSMAKQRIEDKRKRKGLGELTKRENDVYS